MSGYSITHPDLSRDVLTDHGDGTGTLKHYNPAGTVTSTQQVTGMEVTPAPPNPAATKRIDAAGQCWWEWLDENGVLQTEPCEEP